MKLVTRKGMAAFMQGPIYAQDKSSMRQLSFSEFGS